MIVPMRKLTVMCLPPDQQRTLEALRELGVLHVTHVRVPAGEHLERARARLERTARVLELLPPAPGRAPSGRSADEVVAEIARLADDRRELEAALDSLRSERRRIEAFGSFDPEATRRLRAQGIAVRLVTAPSEREVTAPAGWVRVLLRQDKKQAHLALIGRGQADSGAFEVALPEVSLAELDHRMASTLAALQAIDRTLEAHAGDAGAVTELAGRVAEEVECLEVGAGMGSAGPIVYVYGFCPVDGLPAVERAAAEHGWGLRTEQPRADDQVPTLLRNPRWVRIIKPVFDFIGVLPGYGEMDVSAIFLLFFSLFFAMIVGDAGYGVLLLIGTLWARRRFPDAPRPLFSLLLVMSVGTVIWGALTGIYFGLDSLPAPLRSLQVGWLANDRNVMFLCFLIGAVHLTIAHIWAAIRCGKSLRVLAQVGWICTTWFMFFTATSLVLAHAFPTFMFGVLAVGVVLITLFMTPLGELKAEWFNHVILPLNVISNFVDVVSYVRLFAVGMATYAVASAFNGMAVGDGIDGVLAGLAAALVIFAGHSLNIVMALMGVLVHGIRLNALEFSTHLGLQWKGLKYSPFARRAESP